MRSSYLAKARRDLRMGIARCDCGNKAVAITSDGFICQRCRRLENERFGHKNRVHQLRHATQEDENP